MYDAELIFIFIGFCLVVGVICEVCGYVPNDGANSGDFPG